MANAKGVLAVAGAATLFGTSATSQALLAPDAPATSVAAMRVLVGAIGLVVVVLVTRKGRTLIHAWRTPLVWVMGLAVAGYQALFFIGADRAGVAVGTLVSLAFAPFLAGVLGWLWREGAPGWVWAISTVLAVVGVALLTAGNLANGDPLGMLSAAGAGTCYAVYTVIGVRLTRAQHHPTSILAASFSIGAVVLLPAALSSTWWMSPTGVLEVLWLGLVTTTLGYVLFGVGLRLLQPGHIATINLLEPAVATVLGVLVLGETLSVTGWLGCVVVFAALAVLAVADSRTKVGAST